MSPRCHHHVFSVTQRLLVDFKPAFPLPCVINMNERLDFFMQTKTTKSRRIEIFDGMRGLAAIIVMVFHLIVMVEAGHASNASLDFKNKLWAVFTLTPLKLLWAGNEAVILFYIIGGFVIAKPYIEGRRIDFIAFVKKRFSRLILPYWLILIVTLICIALFSSLKSTIPLSGSFNIKWSTMPSLFEILAQFLAFDVNMDVTAGAFWSIVQEWRIALLIPFIAAALSRYSTMRVVALVALTNWTLDYSFSQLGGYWGESLSRTNYYFIFFFIGAVLCKHIEQLRAIVASRPWVRMVSGILLPFLIPFQWVAAGLGIDLGRRDAMPVTALGIVLLLLVVMETPWLSRLFKQPIFLYLGKISFSLYLTHTTAIVLFTTVVGQFIEPQWALMLSPTFALGFAALWYTFVEERLGAVKWPKFQTTKKVLS